MKEKYRKRLVAIRESRAKQPKGSIQVKGVKASRGYTKGWKGQRISAKPKNLITYINCF